jgi:DNA-binding GntR family transcriptional regulator
MLVCKHTNMLPESMAARTGEHAAGSRDAIAHGANRPGNGGATVSLTPIDRLGNQRRTSDRVLDELANEIRTLRLRPGQVLSESELARQLGVSRTPVREALARLVDMGLVMVVPQVGTRVELIRLSEVEQARFMREHLEVAAFESAAQLPEVNTSLARHFLDEQRAAAASGDLGRFFAADEMMHEQIFAMCGYGGVWQAVRRVKLQLDRLRMLSETDPATLAELLDDHERVIAALEARDLTAGRWHVRTHARRAIEKTPVLREKYPQYFAD